MGCGPARAAAHTAMVVQLGECIRHHHENHPGAEGQGVVTTLADLQNANHDPFHSHSLDECEVYSEQGFIEKCRDPEQGDGEANQDGVLLQLPSARYCRKASRIQIQLLRC